MEQLSLIHLITLIIPACSSLVGLGLKKKKSSWCFHLMFYFPFAGQASNRCHWVCNGCCWCLLLAGLAPGQIQREAVLTGCWDELGAGRGAPGWGALDSLWPQLLLRLTNNCVAFAEGSTCLLATYAFISLLVMIFVVVWECL